MIRPEDDELIINCGGFVLGGWTEIRVTRGVERFPSDFVVGLTEKFPGQIAAVPAVAGTACTVSVQNRATGAQDRLLTGYIDAYMPEYDSDSHQVVIGGRSLTEDLVDSSLDWNVTGAGFHATTVFEAAQKLAAPFGVNVVAPDGPFPIPPPNNFPVNPGVTVYTLLEEVCRSVGCLLWDDENGNLVISKVGTVRAGSSLVEGINVERGKAAHRTDQRYTIYLVHGQGVLPGEKFLSVEGRAYDPEVSKLNRYRVLVIPWEGPEQNDAAGVSYSQRRALWAAAHRFGHGHIGQITVTGWRDGAGNLWRPNTVVSVQCPNLKLNSDLVISEVTWLRNGQQGTQTLLTVMPAAGLMPAPLIVPIPGMLQGPETPGPAPQSPGGPF